MWKANRVGRVGLDGMEWDGGEGRGRAGGRPSAALSIEGRPARRAGA